MRTTSDDVALLSALVVLGACSTSCDLEPDQPHVRCWSCVWDLNPSSDASYALTPEDLADFVSGDWHGTYRDVGIPDGLDLTIRVTVSDDPMFQVPMQHTSGDSCTIPRNHGCAGIKLFGTVKVVTSPAEYGFEADQVVLWGTSIDPAPLDPVDVATGTIPRDSVFVSQPHENAATLVDQWFLFRPDGLWMKVRGVYWDESGPLVRIGERTTAK